MEKKIGLALSCRLVHHWAFEMSTLHIACSSRPFRAVETDVACDR